MGNCEMKRCAKCSESKPLGDFHNDKTKLTGKSSYCKKCTQEHGINYRRAHRKEKAERDKIYNQTHRE